MTRSYPLEPPIDEMRRLVDDAMRRLETHIGSLDRQPADRSADGARLAPGLRETLPETGQAYSDLLDTLFESLIPASFNCAGPGYLAYIPGGGIFHAAVADLISNTVNRYVGVWAAAPGLAQLESNVVQWLCEIVGYPSGAGGFLTSGGSIANFSAVFTARRELLTEDFLSGTLYTSTQAHHSLQKAAILAGFPPANVRRVPTDESYRIRTDALEQYIEEDRRNGFVPFFIGGNGGTTNTGAVDPIERLSSIANHHKLWLHIDAAYGGFFNLTKHGKNMLRGIHLADSITLDPHKGLFLPFGTGSLIVREQNTLLRAHQTKSVSYLPDMQEDEGMVDFCEISPELSRDFRGLRVWLPIKLLGIQPFREALEEKLALVDWATNELRKIPHVEIVAAPQLSIVTFRLTYDGLDTEAHNSLNRAWLADINARQRVLLTGTMLDGTFVLRICVLSFRTHQTRMEMCLSDIRNTSRTSSLGRAKP